MRILILAAIAAMAIGSAAQAAPCKDANGKFIKCPSTTAAATSAKATTAANTTAAKANAAAAKKDAATAKAAASKAKAAQSKASTASTKATTAAAATPKHCVKGKACGNSCIKTTDICHKTPA